MKSLNSNIKIIAVVGANGKMGREVCKMISKNFTDYKIKKINKNNHLVFSKNLCLVIDFATSNSSLLSAKFCSENAIPLIIGSTGQTLADITKIKNYSQFTPIVKSGNFSLGIFYLKSILKSLTILPVSDVCITDKHHKFKKDAPSGTALELESVIIKSIDIKPQILSERGGQELGTHIVDIYFGSEKLTFSHQAYSREAFSYGVKICAKVLLEGLPPKLYTFDEILSFSLKNNQISIKND